MPVSERTTTYAKVSFRTLNSASNAWNFNTNANTNNRNNSNYVLPVSDLSDQMNFQYPTK